MRESNYIQELLTDLSKNGVKFIVAGGVAVVLQGIDRATMDIDLALDLEKRNLERFLEVMVKHGMTPRPPVAANFILDLQNLRHVVVEKHARVFTFHDPNFSYKQIDFFLTDDLAYKNFEDHCDKVKIADEIVKVLSIDQLIATKKLVNPPRTKDIMDIEELIKLKASK